MDFLATYDSPTLRPSGTTFAQLQSGGLSGHVEALIAANSAPITPALAAPSVAPAGGGVSGGLLPAGTYILSYAGSNGFGETLPSADVTFAIAAGNIPRWTNPQAIPAGLSSWNVYLTRAGGATGTKTLYARGVSGASFDLAANAWAGAAAPPTANTTAVAGLMLAYLRAPKSGKLQDAWEHAAKAVSNFLQGEPIATDEHNLSVRLAAAVFKGLLQVLEEAATLIHANSGTLSNVTTSPGRVERRRTFP